MITDVISSGITYLQTQQQKDGSFLSLSSPSPTSFKSAFVCHSTFSTALILSCLNKLKDPPNIAAIKRKAASFLLTQKGKHWSFNYWVRGSKEAKEMPYPDDLDDTFCALSAIFQYNPKLLDGKALATVVTLLTSTEEKEGGPYRTWIVPERAPQVWRDVDVAVNSNIAYFLSLQEIALPSLTTFIESRIAEGSLISPYYPTVFPLLYFISRFYKGDKMEKLKRTLLAKRDKKGSWENPLNTALSLSSLINFTSRLAQLKSSVEYLLSTQQRGYWKPHAFVIELVKKDKTYYSGSSALTTAFCLEALGKYLKVLKTQSTKITKRDAESKHIQNQVVLQVRQRFSHLSKELNDQAESILTGVLKMDAKNQITLLPYFFKTALGRNGTSLPDKLLVCLGVANTYGWIAYTIYDNFWDEEGDPKTLSAANIALRELTRIFYEILPNNPQFHEVFNAIMDDIEWSNTWETTYCRVKVNESINLQDINLPHFGNYEVLAQKSLGHALGPLAILFFLGYKKDSSEAKNLLSFFKHYLIARQLNDDAHDWEKDLKNGHINPVCAMLIRKFEVKNKKNERSFLFLELMPKLQELFWYEVIVSVCELILRHVVLARISLSNLLIMENQVFFRELLNSIEQSAKQALEERKKTLAFIKSY